MGRVRIDRVDDSLEWKRIEAFARNSKVVSVALIVDRSVFDSTFLMIAYLHNINLCLLVTCHILQCVESTFSDWAQTLLTLFAFYTSRM